MLLNGDEWREKSDDVVVEGFLHVAFVTPWTRVPLHTTCAYAQIEYNDRRNADALMTTLQHRAQNNMCRLVFPN